VIEDSTVREGHSIAILIENPSLTKNPQFVRFFSLKNIP